MMKRASGMAARMVRPCGLMWVLMIAFGIAAPWVWQFASAWLVVNGIVLGAFILMSAIRCGDGQFDWKDIDRAHVVWALLSDLCNDKPASFLRLIVWSMLIPAEIFATCILLPITMLVRLLLRPMPGKW